MLASPKYVITCLVLVLLVCPCPGSPTTINGYPAVGAIQGNVSMKWQINTTGISSNRFVVDPSGSTTVIFFPANSVIGTIAAAFTNRVRDVGNVSLGNVSFTLLNLTVADAGRYFFKIFPDTDAGGQFLVIAGYPANVSVQESLPANENKEYKLQCSAESTSVPLGTGLAMQYQWKRENGQIIAASGRYSFSIDQSTLIINPLKKEDNGTVLCEAWDHIGAVSQSDPFPLIVILEQGSNTTDTNMTSTPTTTLPPNDTTSNISIKVIVPAVVVPCGLLIIGAIVLAIFCVRRKARKNVRERPDGTSIQDKGNNIDGWKQSLGQGKTTDNLDTAHTTPDGFIIYPGPAALSTARSYKDNKYHGVTDQYSRPSPGTHHHQADYIPSTYTPARAYTHSGEKRLDVTDQYGRPYPGNYGNQTANFAGTYKSARNYAQKGKTYEGPQPVYNLMSNSRLAYGQTAYYPQTGYYGQSDQDVYYSGGQQYSYGQRSRSHHGHSGRKPQRDYYSQYEMADYGSNGAGHRHTKQNPAFYY